MPRPTAWKTVDRMMPMAASRKLEEMIRIATIPIYVIGHGLNTALSILGAYVHTGRLQFIEFFGKFYEGNGVYFRPLQRKNKYTQITKDKEMKGN